MRYMFFLFLLLPMGLLAMDNDLAHQKLEEANQAFLNEDFPAAALLYESLIDAGFDAAPLYYNLGNTYFRLGNMGKAILNYHRSLRIDPQNENTQFNLQVAQARTKDRIYTTPQIFYIQWWNRLVESFNADGWAKIVIAVLLVLLITMAAFIVSRNPLIKKVLFCSAAILLFLLIVSWSAAQSKYHRAFHANEAIIMVPTAVAHSSPSASSSQVFVIHEGAKVQITDALNGWYEIELANKKVGWLNASYLEKI